MSEAAELQKAGTDLVVASGMGVVTVENVRTLTGDVVFAPGNLERILAGVEAEVRAFEPDISTEKGRKAIASLAMKVAKTKTGLDDLGKSQTDVLRKQAEVIHADRRVIVKRLDALRDEVRAPLTEWEARRDAEIAAHERALSDLEALAQFSDDFSPTDVAERIDGLVPFADRDWGDFKARASKLYAVTADRLKAAQSAAVQREEERAELERLRAKETEDARQAAITAQKEREARIAAEAAERAKLEAEERAEHQRLTAIREAERQAQEAAERERKAEEARKAAEERAEQSRLAAEVAERRRLDDVRRAQEHAAEQLKRAEERAEQNRSTAVAAEQKRVADQKMADEAAARKREANKAHRARINAGALAALVGAGLSEAAGKLALIAIARGEVPNVSIIY